MMPEVICQWGTAITQIRLMIFPATTHVTAAALSLEQLPRQRKDRECDRTPFQFVGVEERIIPAGEYACELPAEIVGILDARIQALCAARRMNVCGIAHEEATVGARESGQPPAT